MERSVAGPAAVRAGFADLSVVIPVGPGDRSWRALVARLAQAAPDAQVLLVFADGDRQRGQAPAWCDALAAPTGRARQLNAGVDAAQREWLWLLHADSRLCPGTLAALREYLATWPRALGWFRLAFDDDGPALTRLNAFGANLRARWLGLPFGDQGFVLHREDAARIGRFDPALAYGEDHAWVWRARRARLPLREIPATLATSARKYAAHGWWATTREHLRLTWRQARAEKRR